MEGIDVLDKKERQAIANLRKRFYARLGARIEKLCELKKTDKKALAEKIGFTLQQFRSMELGSESLTYQQCILLAKAFKLSPADLFTGVDEPEA
jgi:transcriptional regulator with XRE-family HTH domain